MKERSPLKIAATKGYVTLIKGHPGTGKTLFSLSASAYFGKIKYISYSEPESYIKEKLKNTTNKKVELKFLNVIGNSEIVISEILDGLKSGYLVIIDSINALLENFKEKRPIEQILYGSSKAKNGTLMMIYEGESESEADYISDAILNFGYTEIKGRKIRSIKVIKDRNFPVREAPFLFTIVNNKIKVFNTSLKFKLDSLSAIKRVDMPESPYKMLEESDVLVKVSKEVHNELIKLMKVFFATFYKKKGMKVLLELAEEENEDFVKNIIVNLAGENFIPIFIKKPYLKSYEEAKDYLTQLEKYLADQDSGILISDTLSEEGFASSEASLYSKFLQEKNWILKKHLIRKLTFSYENYVSTIFQEKYSDAIKSFIDFYGTLVWISEKPLGNAYAIEVKNAGGFILKNYKLV